MLWLCVATSYFANFVEAALAMCLNSYSLLAGRLPELLDLKKTAIAELVEATLTLSQISCKSVHLANGLLLKHCEHPSGLGLSTLCPQKILLRYFSAMLLNIPYYASYLHLSFSNRNSKINAYCEFKH